MLTILVIAGFFLDNKIPFTTLDLYSSPTFRLYRNQDRYVMLSRKEATLVVFQANGKVLSRKTSKGKGPDSLEGAAIFQVDNQHIWVLNSRNEINLYTYKLELDKTKKTYKLNFPKLGNFSLPNKGNLTTGNKVTFTWKTGDLLATEHQIQKDKIVTRTIFSRSHQNYDEQTTVHNNWIIWYPSFPPGERYKIMCYKDSALRADDIADIELRNSMEGFPEVKLDGYKRTIIMRIGIESVYATKNGFYVEFSDDKSNVFVDGFDKNGVFRKRVKLPPESHLVPVINGQEIFLARQDEEFLEPFLFDGATP